MDHHDTWLGIKLGTAGISELLESSRSAILSSDGCEDLYNKARAVTLQLIRSDRMLDEVWSWKDCFYRLEALALGSRPPQALEEVAAEDGADYLLLLANRLQTLEHLLADQIVWKENYSLPSVLDLPFIRDTVLFLADKGSVKMEDYFAGVGIKNTSCVSILAPLRLLCWAEEPNGAYVWLSRTGMLLAIDLKTEARLRVEAQ